MDTVGEAAKAATHVATAGAPLQEITLAQRVLLAVAPAIVALMVRVIGWTLRFEVIRVPGAVPASIPATGIYCFWHRCTLPCTYYFRKFHGTILVSRSFDGELIARTLAMFGFYTVRGSSSRGGASGLLQLKSVIDAGKPVVFTADGPRGPIYETKMGPVKLAQIAAAPVGSFYLLPERAWVAKSWDRFLIPKPFSRVVVSWGPYVTPPDADASDLTLEAKRSELNEALECARRNAERHLAVAGNR
ncbi:MAG TPA: lysophospholipid acyltransferase family protein [Acidisarcina sp.]